MADEPRFEAAMYGTVMRGMPHHDRIAGSEYLGEARTVPAYRLLTVGGEYPLLVPDAEAGGSIDVQVFALTASIWRGKVDAEPTGLVEGEVALADGRTVAVMLGDPDFVAGRHDVEDITAHGGWRAYVEGA
ncbi:MAG: allophanate hydrolase [Thermoleophilaceae bacterium]|jgi:allophanate hydrolase|nr:allophanate hydrolase [Thermoleophilaceae bacterium]